MLTLRIELSAVQQWLYANKLTLNVKKTKLMIFGTKNKLRDIPQDQVDLILNNEKIELVRTFKYLGVQLDNMLTFEPHIDYIYRKSCQKLGAIKKCHNVITTKLANMLYKSLILPLLDYCDIAYTHANQKSINKLQLVQTMACHMSLCCGNREHVANMHNRLKLDLLSDRRDKHLVVECHKNIHLEHEQPLSRYFKLKKNTVNRRTRRGCNYDVEMPKVISNIGRKAFSYMGP